MRSPCARCRRKNGVARIRIEGGRPLSGEAAVSGAKNAALPAFFACLLTEGECALSGVPALRDIESAARVLRSMGAECKRRGGEARICAANLRTQEAPYDLVKTMRASVLALGPLLARFGRARVSMPGGCAIGARPVDIHLDGMRALGADVRMEGGDIVAHARRLRGARIPLRVPSVTATENLMMAAALAEGETAIENAAREPEIADLAVLLNRMGADISGAGEGRIIVRGASALRGAAHEIMPDRIEAGTYLCAVAACGGDVTVAPARPGDMGDLLGKLSAAGAQVEAGKDKVRIVMDGRPRAVDAETAPHPGFPTDMQAQWLAVNCVADGRAAVTENIFENRFMHVPELARTGARIALRHNTALVRGVPALSGAPMMATDLRASASLVIAALAARGESVIDRVYHLERGYENLAQKLSGLGARAERMP